MLCSTLGDTSSDTMASKRDKVSTFTSQRGLQSSSSENILLEFFGKAAANPFHNDQNPDGVINMGTSENKLILDVLRTKLSTINIGELPTEFMQYNDMRGTPAFRKVLATFLTKYMKPIKPINMDDLFVFNGCGSVLEMLGFSICDNQDCLLIPAPYYGAFQTDLALRMGCVTISIELTSAIKAEFGETEPFELSVGRMEEAYKKAVEQGQRVRGIILSNPNNPLGNVYSKTQLISYLQFADKYRLHVILDEIYFLSIYDSDVSMTTGLSLSGAIDPNLLHIVWGFSKDFAISGFRCGLVHTVNKELVKILHANAYFQSVPTITQYILSCFVEDFDWLDNVYFPTNQKRLKMAKDYVCSELATIGISSFPAVGGLYVWVDFREFVRPLSKEGELKLMEIFVENGVYITAGCAFYSPEFGWFRIIFSMNDVELKVGVQRIKKVLLDIKQKKSLGSPGNEVKTEERLDDLVATLQNQISQSDWLKNNTAEKWTKENPELASRFLEEKKQT